MNVLALYTASSGISVAAEGSAGSFLISANTARQQAEYILCLMEQASASAGFSLKETELITAAEGPGAFTGLRLSFSAAKAVQLSARCPFIPVPTFEAWAHSLLGCITPLVCVMDAKKMRFYAQVFKEGKPLSPVADISPEQAARELARILFQNKKEDDALAPKIITITEKDGRALCADSTFISTLETQCSQQQMPVFQFAPVPSEGIFSMITLAKERLEHYRKANIPIDNYACAPSYIRKSDAETQKGL